MGMTVVEKILARASGRDDHVVEMWVPGHHRRGGRLDDVGDMGVGKSLTHTANGRRREHDVANLAKAEEENTRN